MWTLLTSTALNYITGSISLLRLSPIRRLNYRYYRLRCSILSTLLLSLWIRVVAVVIVIVLLVAAR